MTLISKSWKDNTFDYVESVHDMHTEKNMYRAVRLIIDRDQNNYKSGHGLAWIS